MENRRNRENVLQPFRTPRDDAPQYNSKYWEGKDYSYIYHLTQHYVQELRANKEQNKWCTTQEEEDEIIADVDGDDIMRTRASTAHGEQRRVERATCEPTNSAYLHTYPETKPSSWLARLLYYIAPSYFQREQALRTMMELQRLSSEELLELMQLTLAAGEMERSSEIARELSLRRVNLTLQPVHASHKTTVNKYGRHLSSSQSQQQEEECYNNKKNNNQSLRYNTQEHCNSFTNNISAQRTNGNDANMPFANTRMTSRQSHWH